MAIGPNNQVTTTGLMGETPNLPAAPDMSGLSQAQPQSDQSPAPMAEKPAPTESQDINVEGRLKI